MEITIESSRVMKPLPALGRFSSSITLSVVLVFLISGPKAAAQVAGSAADRISGSYFFQQRLDWVGDQPPSASESEYLWEILDGWRKSGKTIGLTDLEMFVAAYPDSPWAPSLHANLGKLFRDAGRYSLT